MIKEQTPYFAHDFNATMDPKIQDMLFDLGPSGFVYWAIIETLWQQQGKYPLAKIRNIALIAHAKPALIEKVIKEYGLFEYNDKDFWSPSQISRQEQRNALIKSRQEAGRKGGKSKSEKQKQSKAKDELKQIESNKLNKTQEKETKVKENNNADALDGEIGDSLFPGMESPEYNINPEVVMNLWNDIISETGSKIPRVQSLSDKRRNHIRARLRAFTAIGKPLEVAERIIRKGFASSYLCTQRWFNFDWVFCAESNWNKINDGNYDNRPTGNQAGGYDRLHITATSPEDYEGDF